MIPGDVNITEDKDLHQKKQRLQDLSKAFFAWFQQLRTTVRAQLGQCPEILCAEFVQQR